MAHLNIEKISLATRNREKEISKSYFRKKVIFLLIAKYLEENGCINSSDALKSECKMTLSDSLVCDNINLESILQDFESYHFLKYQKLPQLIKKTSNDSIQIDLNVKSKIIRVKSASKSLISTKPLTTESLEQSTKKFDFVIDNERWEKNQIIPSPSRLKNSASLLFEKRGSEWQLLADVILQDIGFNNRPLDWSDIVGLEQAKQILKEAVIYPFKYKEFFSLDVLPWKSILLYGPTGTGKTSLASVVASSSKALFFKITASTLTSKWRGESEKLVKVLFELAKHFAPSVIFIDEVDSLISHRGPDHEASRRMKTEFFTQMDSLSSCGKSVVVLAATNIPWDLDQALLRRMEKRLFIPLPDFDCRMKLFKKCLPPTIQLSTDVTVKTDLNYEELACASDKFSPSDIELVCKEAKMNLMRKFFQKLENSPCSKSVNVSKVEVLKMTDLLVALKNIHPSNSNSTEKYLSWRESYGCE